MNKLIEFLGEKYSVDISINWLVIEEDGDVFGYETEPYFDDEFAQFLPINDGEIEFLTTLKGDKKTIAAKQFFPVNEIKDENI